MATRKEAQDAVVSDPEARKKFKSQLVMLTTYMREIEDKKEGLSESVADIALEHGLDKKLVRKMSTTMFKSNYGSLLQENRHFEQMYEQIVEGKLRDPLEYDDKDDEDGDE